MESCQGHEYTATLPAAVVDEKENGFAVRKRPLELLLEGIAQRRRGSQLCLALSALTLASPPNGESSAVSLLLLLLLLLLLRLCHSRCSECSRRDVLVS